jgi:hypothetical protein
MVGKETASKAKFDSSALINGLVKMRALFEGSLTHGRM